MLTANCKFIRKYVNDVEKARYGMELCKNDYCEILRDAFITRFVGTVDCRVLTCDPPATPDINVIIDEFDCDNPTVSDPEENNPPCFLNITDD